MPNLKAFNAHFHVKISDICKVVDQNGACVTATHIPRIKTNQTHGEDTFWAQQGSPTCPEAALQNYICVNSPQSNEYLFSYTFKGERCPLTKMIFIRTITAAAEAAEIPSIRGHAFQIEGTLEYLLQGFSFETVKIKGRWSSDAFLVYLHHHAEVMAPYMQAKDELHTQFFQLLSKCKL